MFIHRTETDPEGHTHGRDSSPGSGIYSDSDHDIWGDGSLGYGSDAKSDKDYTACSLEDCGYCGHCDY